ncbi:MAG: protoporphyrinogen oxidase HemJ [Arcobacteraceae bacterium]|jgi:putative membrane protein|nr:protoporphyrinogen oxidase HemJ [Arcobacteraceae bacterium]MDY0365224.1 protoporphyrinogen oxidase HemJ [Arcobacteraceae bacterium]
MEYYMWIVAFHILSFTSWMAMLFYLPRLFVYHSEHKDKKEFVEVVKIQEYKLYKYIGLPAMWATVLSGSLMVALNPAVFDSGGWMHAKLTVVVLLLIYSFSLEYYRKQLANDECNKSGKFFRFYNEVPTILAIMIVVFVVVKPF